MRILLVLSIVAAIFFIGTPSPRNNSSSWLEGGRVLSPFEVYDTKYLVSADQDGVTDDDSKVSRWIKSRFGRQVSHSVKQGTVLSLVLKPSCRSKADLNIQVPMGLELRASVKEISSDGPIPSLPLRVSQSTSSAELNRWAESDDCVLGLTNRRIFFPSALGSDPQIAKQTHWKSLQLVALYPRLKKLQQSLTKKITIAIIDTGIDLKHPDLKSNLWVNRTEFRGRLGHDDDGNGYEDDVFGFDFASDIGDPSHKHSFDHGTHVAGLAAAVGENGQGGRGVMSSHVQIMALNVAGKYKGALSEDIEEAIYYAVKMRANVINVSMGGAGRADSVAHAISYAVNQGVMVVASVGNHAKNLDQHFVSPGSYGTSIPGLISVGSFEVNSGKACDDSNFSSRFVEVSAPGCDSKNPKSGLFSTQLNATYGYRKGTSMAAPLVSGAVALYMSWLYSNSYETKSSPAQVEQIFTEHMSKSIALRAYTKEGAFLHFERLLNFMPLKE